MFGNQSTSANGAEAAGKRRIFLQATFTGLTGLCFCTLPLHIPSVAPARTLNAVGPFIALGWTELAVPACGWCFDGALAGLAVLLGLGVVVNVIRLMFCLCLTCLHNFYYDFFFFLMIFFPSPEMHLSESCSQIGLW